MTPVQPDKERMRKAVKVQSRKDELLKAGYQIWYGSWCTPRGTALGSLAQAWKHFEAEARDFREGKK